MVYGRVVYTAHSYSATGNPQVVHGVACYIMSAYYHKDNNNVHV